MSGLMEEKLDLSYVIAALCPGFMKTFIAIMIVVVPSVLSIHAQEITVRIVGKETSSALIKVDNVWRKDVPERLKVRLRADVKTSTQGFTFKAYFFNGGGILVRSQVGPNPIWTGTKRGIEEVGLPALLETARASEVFLALPEEMKRIRTTIVVYGNATNLRADIYPGGKKIEDFDFPEKAAVSAAGSR